MAVCIMGLETSIQHPRPMRCLKSLLRKCAVGRVKHALALVARPVYCTAGPGGAPLEDAIAARYTSAAMARVLGALEAELGAMRARWRASDDRLEMMVGGAAGGTRVDWRCNMQMAIH